MYVCLHITYASSVIIHLPYMFFMFVLQFSNFVGMSFIQLSTQK